MQHLSRSWRNAAVTSGVSFHRLDHTDPESAAEHLRAHGVTATRPAENAWGQQVMHALTVDGGFSFHDHVGDGPTGGFMVSLAKTDERAIPARDITGETVADFAALHQQALKDPDTFLGAWVWQGKVYLDLSHHVASRAEALSLAKAHSQIGIYDIAAGKTIVTATGAYEGAKVAVLTDYRRAYVRQGASQSNHEFANALRQLAGEQPL